MAKKSEGSTATAAGEKTSTAVAKARAFVDGMRKDATTLQIAAEVVLRSIEDRHDPGYAPVLCPADEALLRAAGHEDLVKDSGQLKAELSRIAQERALRQAAGSASAFKAALDTLAAAEEAESTRGAALDAQIEKLQAERAEIFDRLAEATATVDSMKSARQRMRALAPRFIQQQVDFARRSTLLQQRPGLTTIEDRINEIEHILALDGRDARRTVAFLEANAREDLVKRHQRHDGADITIDLEGLDHWKSQLMHERARLERELEPKRCHYNECMQAAEQPLDKFVEAAIERADWPEEWIAEAEATTA